MGEELTGLECLALFQVPEPHPLDYDWRFEQTTAKELGVVAPRRGRLLAVGAPTVARLLQAANRELLLVDRQPLQGVTSHLAREAGTFDLPDLSFEGAIVDPPWYPDKWRLWTAWVARAMGLDGEFLVSIWPREARPTAPSEITEIEAWLGEWAEFEYSTIEPRYEVPLFEQTAIEASSDKVLAISPRIGRLLQVRVKQIPFLETVPQPSSVWQRFVVDNYQLALRVKFDEKGAMAIHPLSSSANRWTRPFVSERAPERELVDLWSSRNEVARVGNYRGVRQAIQAALKTRSESEFERALIDLPELLSWQLPRPPYGRVVEWQHQQ